MSPPANAPSRKAAGSRHRLLLVEDDALVRVSIRRFFETQGFSVAEAESLATLEGAMKLAKPDAAICDYQLPDGDGLEVLATLRAADASLPVVMLTAHGSIDLAVRAIQQGADQFLTKPVDLPALLLVLERLLAQRRQQRTSVASRARADRDAADPFVGDSPAIRRLSEQAQRVAGTSACVLLQGESGSGKGVLARWLHDHSDRGEEAFVDVNCAGLSRELLESELFGHEKGAFTGAVSAKPGLLEIAHRGTLFLDEVGDADLQVQAKLLKVLDDQRFRRVGDVKDRQVDVRLVAATHHDLGALVEQGRFREDLFYRISAIPIFVPPLRERGNDVTTLAHSLLGRITAELGCTGLELTSEAVKLLCAHSWPGNIRELRNALERAVLLGDRRSLRAEDLAEVVGPRGRGRRPRSPVPDASQLSLREMEGQHIQLVLDRHDGDVREAADVLGLSRSALYQKIKKHGLTLPSALE